MALASKLYKRKFELKSLLVRMGGWVGGGGLNDDNAILNSGDVLVEVGVELGNTLKNEDYKQTSVLFC